MATTSIARRLPRAGALLGSVVFLSLLLSLSACGVTTTAGSAHTSSASPTGAARPPASPTSGSHPWVTQHATQLRVPAGATGFASAACAAGEALVSGGYSMPAVDGWVPFNIESYPSDLTGVAPTTPGQAARGWTVRFYNLFGGAAVTITVTANCLVGAATGVWFVTQRLALAGTQAQLSAATQAGTYTSALGERLAAPPRSGGALALSVQCPVTGAFTVLTGGGWKDFAPTPVNEGVWEGGWPTAERGIDHQTWNVGLAGNRTVDAVAYVVCAKGLGARPLAITTLSTPPLATVACPLGELLVGGGYQQHFADAVANTVNALQVPQGVWSASSRLPLTLTLYGICVHLAPLP